MSSTSTVPLNSSNRFAHIDAMRAFAVLLVVLAHAGAGSIIPGGSGVTIFFTISGYIITSLLLRERDRTGGFAIGYFYERRLAKLAPPFFVAILVPTAIYALAGGPIDALAVVAQTFFVFNWLLVQGSPDVLPGSDVVWSLSVEEQFYIVFALVWILIARRSWAVRALTVLAALAVVASVGLRIWLQFSGASADRIYFGSDTRLEGIAWGILSSVAYWHYQRAGISTKGTGMFARIFSRDWSLLVAAALFLASVLIRDEWFRGTLRFTLQSWAALLVILYGLLPGQGRVRSVFYRISLWRPITLIGLASYSIYLVHLVLFRVLEPYTEWIPTAPKLLLLVAVGIGAGILLYRLVEVPTHSWMMKRKRS